MGFSEWFSWSSTGKTEELPEIFPFPIKQLDFVRCDVESIYSKILTDVIERTHGLKEETEALLWDSAVMTNAQEGLVSLLAKAMTDKQDLFLVYEKAVNVVRKATATEEAKIREDYKTKRVSESGVYVSFKNFQRSDMVKLYSALEYCTVGGLYKSANLSKAIQIKIEDLRKSVSLSDAAGAKTQAAEIAKSLAAGRDVLLGEKDSVETSKPDLEATEKSIMFLNERRSFYLGLPASYMTGVQTTGMGTTGENDTKAIERGLKSYFVSIVKPVLELLFSVKLSYKSQDFRNISGAMEVLKTFDLVSGELISLENKTKILNSLLDLPEDSEGDEQEAPAAPATPPVVATRALPAPAAAAAQ